MGPGTSASRSPRTFAFVARKASDGSQEVVVRVPVGTGTPAVLATVDALFGV